MRRVVSQRLRLVISCFEVKVQRKRKKKGGNVQKEEEETLTPTHAHLHTIRNPHTRKNEKE